jgi:hypothetical protein
MTTTRISAGLYEIAGTTALDGRQVDVRYSVWRHEHIANTWLSETTVDGCRIGSHSDHHSKAAAVLSCRQSAEAGYRTVPGLGICGN